MAITKRMRFEILRRDDHACQYCGEKAPDVVLHVDHILPVALGGTDKPTNLTTACKDCNSGKSSITPDAPMVEKLGAAATMYALSQTDMLTRLRAKYQAEDEYVEQFLELWNVWKYTGQRCEETVPLPPDFKNGIRRFAAMGIPIELLSRFIEVAMSKEKLRGEFGEFRYMVGCVWRQLEDAEVSATLTAETVAVYTELEHDKLLSEAREEAYLAGYRASLED